jgi:outer membrane protein TolC
MDLQTQKRQQLLALVILVSLLGVGQFSCTQIHPLLRPAVRQELRTARPLQPEALLTELPKQLEATPLEPDTEVIKRAKTMTSPDAQTPTVQLALPQVRQNALVHNLDLQVQLFDPAIAEAGYLGERWKFEAILGTGVSYNAARDSAGLEARTVSLTPSLLVPTRAGGIATLSLPFSHRDSERNIPGTFPPIKEGSTDTTGAEVSLDQPLLRGAGFEINYASINTLGLLMRQTDARTKLFTIRVLANAEQFYWQHYAAHENLKIQLQQYELALEQVRTAQRLVEEGARTKIEVTRAQSDAARRFERIILAENNRRRTELALKRVMNVPELSIQSATLILPETPPTPQGLSFKREDVLALALQNRMELFQNEVQLALDRLALKVNRNRVLPDVRFNFNYAFSGSAPEVDKSFELLFDKKFDGYTVGLTATVPLAGNQLARYQAIQQALALSQTEVNRHALELSIREEVLNAINAVELTWQRILSNRAAIARAQETYEDNKLEFQLGKITSTELSFTLDQLADARSALILSLSDFQIALVDLAFATGTTLGQGGVIWTPATQGARRGD